MRMESWSAIRRSKASRPSPDRGTRPSVPLINTQTWVRYSSGAAGTTHILRHHLLGDWREDERPHVLHINRVARHDLGAAGARTQFFEHARKVVGIDLIEGQVLVGLAGLAAHLRVSKTEPLRTDEAGHVEYVRDMMRVVPFVELGLFARSRISHYDERILGHRQPSSVLS